MILTILDKCFTFDNNHEGTQELIETIQNVLSTENIFLSHLIINGQEVYKEHEEYILDNIANINEVEVKVQTIKEFIGSLLVSLNTYTNRAIPEIGSLVNQFYQSPLEQSWITLNQLLDGIGWIYETIKSIDQTQHDIKDWDEFIKIAAIFEVELSNLLEAIENKDAILIADIIQYEILSQFQLIYDVTEQVFEANNI
ncbi:hypothetical protein BGM26_19880 [Bacillus sp. FJAT-29790]|uniref:hypothetical protein n=1 Tax=Bacillus sp. FJAT-29790 TaxID=1895002 RepID=UPI001C245BE0|nr:hypothetical protein [Bacillus sp. FJAT-29790]MBU8881187.1 hypothetical protein [Bacillus sp. FJAT-29790]